ncbi:hypothetical protein A8F94_00120 [Bacillus sp. FJAT-27225]|uniref:hypothetical protein n=1 Tax=Bacillus sp. FJAT-27225 TaxID=1743144 RepID=UPI00080C2864|nr:hypothetical protein [Bacillus sp. FJAT-27225]OCA90347.1 hypothetical protein A8F94_00120 [Bacillus sp. FJAT-27225]
MDVDTLEELILGDNGLIIPLRLGYGLNSEKVSEIIKVLDHLSEEWAESEYIPKKAAEMFANFYVAAYSTLGLYNDEVGLKIEDAVD